jgi:hypothetical protein
MSLDKLIRILVVLARNIMDQITICDGRRLLTGLLCWALLIDSLAITT